MARRGKFRWILVGVVVVGGLVTWSMLPRITTTVVRWTAPHQVADGAAFLTTAGMSDRPAETVFRLTLTPDEAWRLSAQRGWRPRAIFGAGQLVQGTLAESPAVTWSVQLNARTDARGLVGAIPLGLANQLILGHQPKDAPWALALQHGRLVDRQPPTRERRAWSLVVGGVFDLRRPAMHLEVRRLEMNLDLTLTAEGEQVRPTWSATVVDLTTDPAIDSPGLRKVISDELMKSLAAKAEPQPAWLPWDLPVQVEIGK